MTLRFGQYDWMESHAPSKGERLVLNISSVPEPASYAMFVAGLALLGVAVRCRPSVNRTATAGVARPGDGESG